MIKTFMQESLSEINEARKQGATLREIWEIYRKAGVPMTFSTFQFYYHELRK